MKILVINGPNLNLLGEREPGIYGSGTMQDCLDSLRRHFQGRAQIDYFQSNHEGAMIDRLQQCRLDGTQGIALNAGAYTHTSVALHDALRSLGGIPAVEVHISNVYQREPFRHQSLLSAACLGVVCGFGLDSYRLAIEGLLMHDSMHDA